MRKLGRIPGILRFCPPFPRIFSLDLQWFSQKDCGSHFYPFSCHLAQRAIESSTALDPPPLKYNSTVYSCPFILALSKRFPPVPGKSTRPDLEMTSDLDRPKVYGPHPSNDWATAVAAKGKARKRAASEIRRVCRRKEGALCTGRPLGFECRIERQRLGLAVFNSRAASWYVSIR